MHLQARLPWLSFRERKGSAGDWLHFRKDNSIAYQ